MEVKPVRIKVESQTLLAYRDPDVEGMSRPRRFDKVLRRLILHDADSQEDIGCIVFYLGGLAAYSWESKEETDFGKEAKREMALANLLPHIPLGLDHLKEVYSRGKYCLLCSFNKDEDGYKKDDLTEYIVQLKDGFLKTAQRIVFPNGLKKKDIEQEILQILLNSLEENPGTYMLFEDLQASIPLTTKALILHLNLLQEDEKVDLNIAPHSDPPKIVSIKIKSKGIKALEGETETAIQSPQVVKNIYGTNIETTTHGANSPVTINVGKIETVFENIQKEIKENTDLKAEEKKEVSEAVKELEVEITQDKNPKKVAGLVEKLKGSANWVWQKILANPYVSGIIVEILMKATQAQ